MLVRRLAAVAAATVVGVSLLSGPATAAGPHTRAERGPSAGTARELGPTPARQIVRGGVVGADISWPNCPVGMGVPGRRTLGLPLPRPSARFVIIGLTNGRAFTRNPCLATHVQMAKARELPASAYTMLSYPNKAERKRYGRKGPYPTRTYTSRLSNVGYAQAAAALDAMAAAGFDSPFVWIDVEPRVERKWSPKAKRNRALIRGAIQAATDRGIGSGIYTYAVAWQSITKNMKLAVPLWAPGHSHAKTYAKRMAQTKASCSRAGFTGGPLAITQWVWRNRDYDVTCPAISSVKTPLWIDYSR